MFLEYKIGYSQYCTILHGNRSFGVQTRNLMRASVAERPMALGKLKSVKPEVTGSITSTDTETFLKSIRLVDNSFYGTPSKPQSAGKEKDEISPEETKKEFGRIGSR